MAGKNRVEIGDVPYFYPGLGQWLAGRPDNFSKTLNVDLSSTAIEQEAHWILLLCLTYNIKGGS